MVHIYEFDITAYKQQSLNKKSADILWSFILPQSKSDLRLQYNGKGNGLSISLIVGEKNKQAPKKLYLRIDEGWTMVNFTHEILYPNIPVVKKPSRKEICKEIDKRLVGIIKLCDHPHYTKQHIRQVANDACNYLYLNL